MGSGELSRPLIKRHNHAGECSLTLSAPGHFGGESKGVKREKEEQEEGESCDFGGSGSVVLG